ATYGKFYFKHVTIVLPSTWPQTSERQVTGDSLFTRADIRIGGTPSGESASRPFTRHQRGCGERGEYIQFTAKQGILHSPPRHGPASYGVPQYHVFHDEKLDATNHVRDMGGEEFKARFAWSRPSLRRPTPGCYGKHRTLEQRHVHWWGWASHIASPSPTTMTGHGSLSCSNENTEMGFQLFLRSGELFTDHAASLHTL
ncbi:hypothetical protein HPB47_014912, partial [Ixodes persulcatus]